MPVMAPIIFFFFVVVHVPVHVPRYVIVDALAAVCRSGKVETRRPAALWTLKRKSYRLKYWNDEFIDVPFI